MGCEQGRNGKERNESKPVGFNQASAQVLGDKPYGLKRQQFGLFGSWGENGAEGRGAPWPQLCCWNMAAGYKGFPRHVPLSAQMFGVCAGQQNALVLNFTLARAV